ncbi:MAG: hypothetical protein EBU90_06745 [Proteobacteria bacterium]|nr:hypothetical protein [Pseudomonadota bacterium]NBP15006.1 hypothetical protein [bacterium]
MIVNISDKNLFVNDFLVPISKVTNTAVINLTKTGFSSLVSTSDNTIILSSNFNNADDKVEPTTLNIPDISKLVRILSVIDTKDLKIEVTKNNIAYTSSSVRFKYHLFEDGIIISPKLNVNKLTSVDFDGKFTLLYSLLQNLIKGSSIATDSNKIYLSYKDNQVFGELTDKSRPNVDSYGLTISENYKGVYPSIPTPLNFEIFRIISSMKFKELNCCFSSKLGVYIFETNINSNNIKFIVSALAN